MNKNQQYRPPRAPGSGGWERLNHTLGHAPRHTFIALILVAALLAFELFNFDTTKFALNDLLGHVSFLGISWAGILAFAFCAIDFAGLVRIFTPEQGSEEPKAVWYLMGAWLLGATMNAIMTWYAVSLTLLQRPLGSHEVLAQEQLLLFAPVFVAALVWLTRILFIGSLSVAGEHLFAVARSYEQEGAYPPLAAGQRAPAMAAPPTARGQSRPMGLPVREQREVVEPSRPSSPRVRQRPPMVGSRPMATPMSAKKR